MPHHTVSPAAARIRRFFYCASFLLVALALTSRAQTVITGTTTNNTNSTSLTLASAGASYVLNAGTTYQIRSATDAFGIRLNAANISLSLQGTLVNEALLSSDSDAAALRVTGAATSGISVTVGAANNTGALVQSKGNDGIKFTGVGTSTSSPNLLTNYGTVRSDGRVNSSGGSANTYQVSDAIAMGVNTTLNNYGTVTGARHGVDGGAITGLVVNNYAGASLIGRNGSGIGADTTSANAADYVVNNWGTIRGDYAGVGNIFDRHNDASVNGDGDGIDIDGAATINNHATGVIASTGAGGYDSGGRANSSEAISIGGGLITNDGLIQGSDRGIVVNNDSVVSRSGSAATTITNNAGATIEGQNGFAIRLENKLGTAADADAIINAGTIIGGGSIPDGSATVTLQSGATDTNSTGTLDGVSYTGTGSARFIRGDGSAIQMGEGNDTLTNTGTITGSNGRAINMEGGNDTVNFNAGTITGSINGGAGTDGLNLGAGVSHAGAIQNFETFGVASGVATLSGVVSGAGLTKSGAGTLVLSGANDYTGGTTISAGTLRVNNSSGSRTGAGDVSLAAGAMLAGGGMIAGNVLADGAIAPGNSLGVLTVGGNVTWNGSAGNAWTFELGSGSAADLLSVGGDFLKGNGSEFVFDFGNTGTLGSYVLVDWAGATTFSAGEFSYENLAAGYAGVFSMSGSQLEFTTTAVPEPATTAALFAGVAALGAMWLKRRRATVG